jgi:D-alanyl-lipoteichoic acid acyltransferase DltB (MBOAT superfamily)
MLFDSVEFLIFFFVVYAIYWLIPFKAQNVFLLVSSYFFYSFWDYHYTVLLFSDSIICFICGLLIENSNRWKRYFLYLSLVTSLSLLFYFKYLNFTIQAINTLTGGELFRFEHILLPVGISFFTFRSISYIIDVYQEKTKASKEITSFLLYVSFFPQLISGPIERSKSMLAQISTPRIFNDEKFKDAIFIIMWGFYKKIVLADHLNVFSEKYFANLGGGTFLDLAIGSIVFSLQLYLDFSGYSDIAIGTAQLLGFSLVRNFYAPYFSTNIVQFWERWHMSLSNWFKDYVYFPLAIFSLRRGETFIHKYLPHIITMLLVGIWHGAGWNFVIFGLYWGISIVIYHNIRPMNFELNKTFSTLITFAFACFGWMLFRINDISSLRKINTDPKTLFSWDFKVLLPALFLVMLSKLFEKEYIINQKLSNEWKSALSVILILVCVIFGYRGRVEFIYFRF